MTWRSSLSYSYFKQHRGRNQRARVLYAVEEFDALCYDNRVKGAKRIGQERICLEETKKSDGLFL